MDMTPKQRKFYLVCAVIVVGYYVARFFIASSMQAAYYQQQAIRAAQIQQAKAAQLKATASAPGISSVAPVAPAGGYGPPAMALTTLSNLAGIWGGRGTISSRGLCTLTLELRETQDAPGHYSGYSALTCLNIPDLNSPQKLANPISPLLTKTMPAAAVMTGIPENDGSIHFRVDHAVSTDANGCTATAFTMTPFGTNQVAAQLDGGTCQGGQLLLTKMGR
jgi:hypothetical protein